MEDHEKLFDRSLVIPFLEKNYNFHYNEKFTPSNFSIEHKIIKKYFEEFSESTLAKQVGEYTVNFTVHEKQKSLLAVIQFNEGIVKYTPTDIFDKADLSMSCPGGIVQDIILNDMSWDEITYWSKYSRINDEFNIAFWKILHAPWEGRKQKSLEKTRTIAIATILEKGGIKANKIFEKFGLYCAACDASMGESIEEGCKIHGLEEEDTNKLIFELNQLLSIERKDK